MEQNWKENDLVTFEINRVRNSGKKYGKISNIRWGRKGRSYEVIVLNNKGNSENWTIKDACIFKEPSKSEITYIKKHLQKAEEYFMTLKKAKYVKAQEKYKVRNDFALKGYLNMFRNNYDYPVNVKARIQFKEGLFNKKITSVTPNGVVIEGRKKCLSWTHIKDFVFEEKEIPIELNSKIKEDLNKKGYSLKGFKGSEFIVDSISIATNPGTLFRTGTHYECPSREIFFDTEKNVYWRHAGCFD